MPRKHRTHATNKKIISEKRAHSGMETSQKGRLSKESQPHVMKRGEYLHTINGRERGDGISDHLVEEKTTACRSGEEGEVVALTLDHLSPPSSVEDDFLILVGPRS